MSKLKFLMAVVVMAIMMMIPTSVRAEVKTYVLGDEAISLNLDEAEKVVCVYTAPSDGYYGRDLKKSSKLLYRFFRTESEAYGDYSYYVDWENSIIKLNKGEKVYIALTNFENYTVVEDFKFEKKSIEDVFKIDYETDDNSKVTLDVNSNPITLTLNGANLKYFKFDSEYDRDDARVKLNIIVNGDNTIDSSSSGYHTLMKLTEVDVTFAGNGTLNLVGYNPEKEFSNYGIDATDSKITVDGPEINIYSKYDLLSIKTTETLHESKKVGLVVNSGTLNGYVYPNHNKNKEETTYNPFINSVGDMWFDSGVVNTIFVDDGNVYYDNVSFPKGCIVDGNIKSGHGGHYDIDIFPEMEFGIYYDGKLEISNQCKLLDADNSHVQIYDSVDSTYKSEVRKTININDCVVGFDINSGVSDSGTIVETGEAICPGIVVTTSINGEKYTLVEGKDYTLKYENNIDVGVAKAIISGKVRFAGVKEIEFEIIKKEEKIEPKDEPKDDLKKDSKDSSESTTKSDDKKSVSDDSSKNEEIIFTKGKYRYKIIKDANGKKAGKVILLGFKKKSGAKKVVVAKKVKYKGKIYIITKIKKKAFYKKKKVKKVIIKSLKLKKIGKFAFAKISKKAVIKVPKKKFKKYKKLLKRAKFKGKIVK